MNLGKYVVVLLIDFLSQLILFPLCWRIVGDQNFFLAVILTAIVAVGVKLFFINLIEVKSYRFSISRRPLYIYYGVSGVASIFIMPIAFMSGTMAAGGGLLFFLIGFTFVWIIPNGIMWLFYLVGSMKYEEK